MSSIDTRHGGGPRCPTCLGKGFFKRFIEASPPYYADDYFEKVDCSCVEEAVEIVEAALVDESGEKKCPRCQLGLAKSPFYCICLGHRVPPPFNHRALYGTWLCVCGLGFCHACYARLET